MKSTRLINAVTEDAADIHRLKQAIEVSLTDRLGEASHQDLKLDAVEEALRDLGLEASSSEEYEELVTEVAGAVNIVASVDIDALAVIAPRIVGLSTNGV